MPRILPVLLLTLLAHGLPNATHAAEPTEDIRELKLRDWEPKSMMMTKVTDVDKPKFPAIDVHNHLGGGKQTLTPDRVAGYLTEMNEAGVQTVVNLDGGWGERLEETLDGARPGAPGTVPHLRPRSTSTASTTTDWSQREAKRLEESFAPGPRGSSSTSRSA